MEHSRFCQCCGMPLEDGSHCGTEADGAVSEKYCQYCYTDGHFTQDCTMQEMIDFCAPILVKEGVCPDLAAAKAQMQSFFPQLERWK